MELCEASKERINRGPRSVSFSDGNIFGGASSKDTTSTIYHDNPGSLRTLAGKDKDKLSKSFNDSPVHGVSASATSKSRPAAFGRHSSAAVGATKGTSSFRPTFGRQSSTTVVANLTLNGRLNSKLGSFLNKHGTIWYQPKSLASEEFVECSAVLCGPVLQVSPHRRTATVTPFEISLKTFQVVGLESASQTQFLRGSKITVWVFYLSSDVESENGSSGASNEGAVGSEKPAPKAGVRFVFGCASQIDALEWTSELKKAMRYMDKAVRLQADLSKRRLEDVVASEIRTFGNSNSSFQISSSDQSTFLPDFTQVQRNVALMDLMQKRLAPKDRNGADNGIFQNLSRQASALTGFSSHLHVGSFRGRPSPTTDQGLNEERDKEVDDQRAYTRKHFFVKDRGSYYYFWGRVRIRVSFFVRFLAVLLSYPFVVIYSVLDLDKLVAEVTRGDRQVKVFRTVDVSWFFKKARRFVVGSNLALLFMPIVIVYAVLGNAINYADRKWPGNIAEDGTLSADRLADNANDRTAFMATTVIVCVACYSALFLLPIAFAIVLKTRATSNQTDVVDGTFCFRPHYRMRLFSNNRWTLNLNTANLSTLGGVMIEFFLHSFYCLPKCQLSPDECKLSNFELPPQNLIEIYFTVKWRYVFWIMFTMALVNAAVFVMHGVLGGRKKHSMSSHFALWQIVWVLNGPAFVTIVTTLFQAFSCTMVKDDTSGEYSLRVLEDTDLRCWDDSHKSMCVAAFIGLSIYLTQAALLPSGTYKETMRNKLFDILFVPSYLEGHFFLKALFAATYVLFFRVEDKFRIPPLLAVNLLLLLHNMREKPCAVREINTLRTATLSGTVWAGIASLLFVTHLQSDDGPGAECGQNKDFLASLFVTGWVAIFSGAFYVGYTNRESIDSVLAHTFLELERQVQQADKDTEKGTLVGLDNTPLLVGGKNMLVKDAVRIWPQVSAQLKEESRAAALASRKRRTVSRGSVAYFRGRLSNTPGSEMGSETEDQGIASKFTTSMMLTGIGLRAALGVPQIPPDSSNEAESDLESVAPAKEVDKGRQRQSRRSVADMLGLVGTTNTEDDRALGLSDEDLVAIYDLNIKAKLGSVAPRVLEPLISLTLSDDPLELLHAAKYIRELVWCTSINYPRVQFQALWALANLSQTRPLLTGDARAAVVEAAQEQGLTLAPGEDLGSKFRHMIVSTNYIMQSADGDFEEDNLEADSANEGESGNFKDEKREVSRHEQATVEGVNGVPRNAITSSEDSTGAQKAKEFDYSRDRGAVRRSSSANYAAPTAMATEKRGRRASSVISGRDSVGGGLGARLRSHSALAEPTPFLQPYQESMTVEGQDERHSVYDDTTKDFEEYTPNWSTREATSKTDNAIRRSLVQHDVADSTASRRRSSVHGEDTRAAVDASAATESTAGAANDGYRGNAGGGVVNQAARGEHGNKRPSISSNVHGPSGHNSGLVRRGSLLGGRLADARRPSVSAYASSVSSAGFAGVRQSRTQSVDLQEMEFATSFGYSNATGGYDAVVHNDEGRDHEDDDQHGGDGLRSSIRDSIFGDDIDDTEFTGGAPGLPVNDEKETRPSGGRGLSVLFPNKDVAPTARNEAESGASQRSGGVRFAADEETRFSAADSARNSAADSEQRLSSDGSGHHNAQARPAFGSVGLSKLKTIQGGGLNGSHNGFAQAPRGNSASGSGSSLPSMRLPPSSSPSSSDLQPRLSNSHHDSSNHRKGNYGDDDDLFSSEEAEQMEEEMRAEKAEASLGGLRVIYNGFRDMNDTVKLEALAVMVNLSINNLVADSLVFHQAGDTLTHLLELIWAPGLFTKFATLVVTNLAFEEHRRRVILRRGGLAAIVGLLLGSNYELQVAACRCLVNLSLSPARHVAILGTTTLLSRVFTKLGGAEDFQVQVLVARLMQNLCVRPQFANALNDPHLGTAKKLARMRDTYNLHAWRHSRSSSTAGNSSKKGKDEPSDAEFAVTAASEFNVSLSVNFTTNVLLGFKTNAERETVAVQSYSRQPPIHAEVTWDTWGSKIDRMWNPVLTIAPTAQGTHMHVAPWPHFQDINLVAQDMYGNDLNYRVVNKPIWGTITKASSESKHSAHFRYTPFQGHTGFDFFTFKASNAVMDSNLATVSLKVDPSLEPPPEDFIVKDSGVNEAKTADEEPPNALPKTVSTLRTFTAPENRGRTLVKMLSLVGEEADIDSDEESDDNDDFDGDVNPIRLRSKSNNGPVANSFMLSAALATEPAPVEAVAAAPATGATAHAPAPASAVKTALPSAPSQKVLPTAPKPQDKTVPVTAAAAAAAAAATPAAGVVTTPKPTDVVPPATPSSEPVQPPPLPLPPSSVLPQTKGGTESSSDSNTASGSKDTASSMPAGAALVPPPSGEKAAQLKSAPKEPSGSEDGSSDDDEENDMRLTMDITNTNSMGFGGMDSDED